MNQAASATRRAPADSTATAGGCCPMVSAPFFGLPTPAAATQCFLSPQAQQLVQLARRQQQQQQQQQQQSNVVISPQQHTVSQHRPTPLGQQHQQQQQQLQPQPTTQRSHNQTSNHYSTSLAASNLSLQQSIAYHPATNCAALAAALAASLPQFQQQLLLTQNHQATPTNQPTQTVAPSTIVTQPNASPTFTSQVPTLNYNSYSSAQPYINLPTHTVPQSAPPVPVHHQQQTNNIPGNILSTNLNTLVQNAPLSNGANNLHQNVQQLRPLVNNTALQSSTGQLANSIYRGVQQQSTDQPSNVHQQQSSTPTPAQQLGQATRNNLNEETLNLLFNHQFQMLEQFFSNQQFAQPLPAFQLPSQQVSAPQQLVNTPRTQTTLPLTGQSPAVMTHAQQVTSTQIAPPQQHRPSEQASENQPQQNFQHTNTNVQSRLNQAPQQQSTNDSYQSSVSSNAGGSYQSQPNNDLHIHNSLSEPVSQAPHQNPQTLPQPSQVPVSPQNHQHSPSQANMSLPIYPYAQDRVLEQFMTTLAINPAVASNLFSLISYLSNNHRLESHHTHHHPAHHFHPHIHSTHHHHGQNGQANGQDASMPLDSMAINESKPRGLTRAEIDSLTPYMHTNEKDTRSCVICLSKFELKSKIRPLPCNHAFHAKCVDKWLRTNRTCPLCRRDALKTFNGKIKRI